MNQISASHEPGMQEGGRSALFIPSTRLPSTSVYLHSVHTPSTLMRIISFNPFESLGKHQFIPAVWTRDSGVTELTGLVSAMRFIVGGTELKAPGTFILPQWVPV